LVVSIALASSLRLTNRPRPRSPISGGNSPLHHLFVLLGLATVFWARAGFGEVRVRVLYDRVRIPMAQLALQGGIARLFAVVVLGGSFGLVLIMGILRHS